MELVIVIFLGGLISGVIGAFIGGAVNKIGAGLFLGAFLGPVGWIIVLLLPRGDVVNPPSANSAREQDTASAAPERDLNNDAYKIWLGKTYAISRNDLFERYECRDKLFETLEEALIFADGLENERAESAKAKQETMKNSTAVPQTDESLVPYILATLLIGVLVISMSLALLSQL